jgi:hypothetical protein
MINFKTKEGQIMKKEYKTMTMEVVSLNAPNLLIVSNRDVLVDDNANSGEMNSRDYDYEFEFDEDEEW